jgi:hypothetical protein
VAAGPDLPDQPDREQMVPRLTAQAQYILRTRYNLDVNRPGALSL